MPAARRPSSSSVCSPPPPENHRATENTETAQSHPEFAPWIEQVVPRFVDLYQPFRSLHYYHPTQMGSTSIKRVLPALAEDLNYEGMEISNGNSAAAQFMRITFGQVLPYVRYRLRRELERYCALDTLGMVKMIETLRRKLNL